MTDKYHDPKGGLSAEGRKKFKKSDGANLKPGVKSYDSASPADKKRWISWAKRFAGNPQPLTKDNGDPTPYALMFQAWGRPIPKNAADVKATYDLAVRRGKTLEKQSAHHMYLANDSAEREAAAANPVDQKLYDEVVAAAKKKFKVYPSFYANAWVQQEYRKRGGKFKGGGGDDKKPAFLKSAESQELILDPVDTIDGEAVSAEDKSQLAKLRENHKSSQDSARALLDAQHPLAVAIGADADAFIGLQLDSISHLLGDDDGTPAPPRDYRDTMPEELSSQTVKLSGLAYGALPSGAIIANMSSGGIPTPHEVRAVVNERVKKPTDLEAADVPRARAFVTQAHGKTVITGPAATFNGGWQKALSANEHMTWIQGRLVGAETPNRNNALWTSGDLEMGQPTVAHGPLNWLHEARHVIGSIADSRFVPATSGAPTQAAGTYYSKEDRAKYAKSGVAMPDGSWPIIDEQSLRDAIPWARTDTQREHLIKRAKALGKSKLLPATWQNQAASVQRAAETVDPHIIAAAGIWNWLWPDEAMVVNQASELGQLWYSMECISKNVVCSGENGCGHVSDYMTFARDEPGTPDNPGPCEHMKERSSVLRFAEPTFLGAAVIVPPTRPGWADADVSVMNEAASLSEKAYDQIGRPEIPASIFEQMVAQVVKYTQM
jgi:hypothetical protein